MFFSSSLIFKYGNLYLLFQVVLILIVQKSQDDSNRLSFRMDFCLSDPLKSEIAFVDRKAERLLQTRLLGRFRSCGDCIQGSVTLCPFGWPREKQVVAYFSYMTASVILISVCIDRIIGLCRLSIAGLSAYMSLRSHVYRPLCNKANTALPEVTEILRQLPYDRDQCQPRAGQDLSAAPVLQGQGEECYTLAETRMSCRGLRLKEKAIAV